MSVGQSPSRVHEIKNWTHGVGPIGHATMPYSVIEYESVAGSDEKSTRFLGFFPFIVRAQPKLGGPLLVLKFYRSARAP